MILPLYNRSSTTTADECSLCHDPLYTTNNNTNIYRHVICMQACGHTYHKVCILKLIVILGHKGHVCLDCTHDVCTLK